MQTQVIFDIETKKLFSDITSKNPADLGVSIVSLYKRQIDDNQKELQGEMLSFWENDFDKMWTHFEQADLIIGFNSLHFDVPALKPLTYLQFDKLPHFDILQKVKESVGFRISLAVLAKDSLNHSKIDTGLNAVYYWNMRDEKSLAKLKKYCEADVLVTKELYDFGLQNGFLKYTDKWNRPQKVEVDFSYPEKEDRPQASLF
jgi:RNase_H superfamily